MSYQELYQEIERWRHRSAAFHKVDLHVHSHESHDYPKLGDGPHCVQKLTEMDQNPSLKVIQTHVGNIPDLKIVAITDHNKSRVATELSKSNQANQEFVILPGMEVSLQASIFPDSQVHILTIFPEGASSEDIQQLFPPKCGMPPYDDRDEAAVAQTPLDELIERVHDLGGICIAGHVNSNKGIRSLFRDSNSRLLRTIMQKKALAETAKNRDLTNDETNRLEELKEKVRKVEDGIQNKYLELLSSYRFDAVEVQRSADQEFYSGSHTDDLGIRPIACVLGSDAHNVQDIGLQNSSTYVKMTVPGLPDLKRALRDPGTRIRYEDTLKHTKCPRILGIRFNGGFFQTQTLGFSDNLTCLIGGRGTGKSSAIESLRHLFEHPLEHLSDEKRKDISSRKTHTLTQASVEAIFSDINGELYVLKRDHDTSTTYCYNLDGSRYGEMDVKSASNLDVKIYGWGEIEELARNKQEQLKLIDGFVPNVQDYKNEVSESLRVIESNTREIVELVREIEALVPQIEQLSAKEAELERLSSSELDAIFSEFDRNENALSGLTRFNNEIEDLQSRFQGDNGKNFTLSDEIIKTLSDIKSTIAEYAWLDEFDSQLGQQARDLQAKYEAFISVFPQIIQLPTSRIEGLRAEKRKIETDLQSKSKETNAEDQDIPSLIHRRQSLTEEVSSLRMIKSKIDEKQKDVKQLLAKRTTKFLPALQNKRKVLFDARLPKISEINERLKNLSSVVTVSIHLTAQGYREEFRLALGVSGSKANDGILKGVKRQYIKNDYAGLYSQNHTTHSFVQAIMKGNDGVSSLVILGVDAEGIETVRIDEEKAQKIVEHLFPASELDDSHYDPKRLEALLELEHLPMDDLPNICLDGVPIEELSPGQRCSTLIPIILLESSSPLIIDQPEDNLDNKLVFGLVVDILRSLKEQRQIIIATHNPNIPVSGDSEQVIIFEAHSQKSCDIAHQGSIDDSEIVRHIKAIMEGSDEAFRIRAEKYGYQLQYLT